MRDCSHPMFSAEIITGPFFSLTDAAKYCDYALGTFERILRDYDLPKYGPKKNRFAKSILDEWMVTPEVFKKNSRPKPRRRVPKPVII